MEILPFESTAEFNRRKFCDVCGDQALGYNFNGLTCVSCKAFFRRAAQREKPFTCKYDDACPMNKYCRIKCKSCRLKRCFEIGMKKELISHRSKRFQKKFKEEEDDEETEENEENEENEEIAQQLTDRQLSNDTRIAVYSENWSKKVPSLGDAGFSSTEMGLLLNLNRTLSVFRVDPSVPIVGVTPSMLAMYNSPGKLVKRVIYVCKKFPTFRCLAESDQLSLLQAFFTKIMIVTTAFQTQLNQDGFTMICDEKETKAVFTCWNVYDELDDTQIKETCRSYHYLLYRELENDTIIRNLVIAYLLFAIDRESSLQSDIEESLRQQQSLYESLLDRYLQCKYGNIAQAKQKKVALMALLEDLSLIIQNIEAIYRYLGRNQVAEVLAEMYEL